MNKQLLFILIFVLCSSFALSNQNTDMLGYYTGDVNGTYADATGKQPNGNIDGPIYTTSGVINGSYDFTTAGNNKINLGSGFQGNYSQADGVSWGAWLYPDATSGSVYIIDAHNGAYQGFFLGFEAGTISCHIGNGVTEKVAAFVAPSTGSWQHWACVWDKSNVIIYLNGTEKNRTANTGYKVNSGSLCLGDYCSGAGKYDGKIDEVFIYNRTLQSSEVLSIYTRNKAKQQYLFPPLAPTITLINFTSDGGATCTWPIVCANTTDPSPTLTVTTDIDAYCRFAYSDVDFTDMNESCTQSGNFNITHSCTPSVNLGAGIADIYLGCNSSDGVYATAPLSNTSKARLNILYPPTASLSSPSNNSAQYGNTSLKFNWSITDGDNATVLWSAFYYNGSVLNNISTPANNSVLNYSYTPLSDCIACAWYCSVSDGTSIVSSSTRYMSFDVEPYNTSLSTEAGTSYDNQTTGIYANYNYTLTNVAASGTCSFNESGIYSDMTFVGSRFEINRSLVFGTHSYTVNCSISNATSLSVASSVFTSDKTAPAVSVNAPANNTHINAANYIFNVTFIDNRTVPSANISIANTTNPTVYDITAGTANITLKQNSLHYWNITATDNESNINTTQTLILIEDSADPQIISVSAPSGGNSNVPFAITLETSDNFENYSSINSGKYCIQQPAGGTTCYDLTIADYNTLTASYVPAAIGTYTITSVNVTDKASNTKANTTTVSISITTPPESSGGGGGGGSGSLTIVRSETGDFEVSPSKINSYFLYMPFSDVEQTKTFTFTANRDISTCALKDETGWSCKMTDNKAEITFTYSRDAIFSEAIENTLTLADAEGNKVSIPLVVKTLNLGVWTKAELGIPGALRTPYLFKLDSMNNVIGVRYLPPFGILLIVSLLFGGGRTTKKWFKSRKK